MVLCPVNFEDQIDVRMQQKLFRLLAISDLTMPCGLKNFGMDCTRCLQMDTPNSHLVQRHRASFYKYKAADVELCYKSFVM
mmetsp:Transcript_32864/g.46697  ORF Transcript_32864/g.46697 Transcript_32864/m.46697 type:complete len:81 (-) Transcript_32864:33-275(-)